MADILKAIEKQNATFKGLCRLISATNVGDITKGEAKKGQRGPKQLEVYRQHWQWIPLGLSRAMFMKCE